MQGFFHDSELLQSKAPMTTIPRCGACGLYRQCKSPKMSPVGAHKRKILIVGQSPGKEEDKRGEPFVGPSGRLLRETMEKAGIDVRQDCLVTNSLICHPPGDKIDDDRKIEYCRPNLVNTIKKYKPEIIVPLGREANISLLGWLYKEDVSSDSVNKWVGWQIPEQSLNTWICPTWHPSYVLRSVHNHRTQYNNVLLMYWLHHFKQVNKLKGRPWKKVPDYESEIEIVTKSSQAAKLIRYFRKKGGLITFDYETNRIKPDNKNSIIVCASVCWRGKRTIAFPWIGDAIDEMKKLLQSDNIETMGANQKFENRWTRRKLGHWIKNVKFCTMNGAHVCDNRPDITGLKFQAFVRLGFGDYSDHIRPFLKAKKGSSLNQILEEVKLEDLLLYCGLDSLLEYYVGIRQMDYLSLEY